MTHTERPESYRRELELDPEASYTYVELGPRPTLHAWHTLSEPTRYPFPTEQAAFRFAENHREPGRRVRVITPDGNRFDL